MRRKLLIALGTLLVLIVLAFALGPAVVERSQNKVLQSPPYAVSPAARRLHDTLFVADLHADALLWDRDLLAWGSRGHLDIPRMQEGGVALQVFSVVTKVPNGQSYDGNRADSDSITALAILQRWPRATWGSLLQRALYQAAKLEDAAARSYESFGIIRSRSDLDDFVRYRRDTPHLMAGLLAIEGLHALEGDLGNVDVLYDAGFRMMAPAHFFDNELGGSAHGVSKGGLTDFGRQVVRRMQEKHIIVDLAHASPRLIDDVLDLATSPVVVSHTGMKGTCDNIRNLSDAHARRVAATGGVIGIGYWDAAICDTGVGGIVRAIRYAADLVGADHVGLGSDFDGTTTMPFDTTGVPLITQGLLDAGFSEADIRKIMGDNVVRVLHATLQ